MEKNQSTQVTMAQLTESPIVAESFALIDQEVGPHQLSPAEYAVVRRVIHSTADFEFKDLVRFSPGAIAQGVAALRAGTTILVDVTMVRQGIVGLVGRTFANPILTAVTLGEAPGPGQTRTQVGLLRALAEAPGAMVVIGNAPTALLALADQITVAAAAVGAQAAQQLHRLQQVRLALAVAADHQQPRGLKAQVQLAVITELAQLQAMQPNGSGAV